MLFFLVTIIYYDASAKYGGEIQNVITFLLGFAVFMTIASLFHYFGHGNYFGLDENCSLKWFQSSWLMLYSLFYCFAGRKLFRLFRGK